MTYEYCCTDCKFEWTAEQKITDDPIPNCPLCGNKTAKRLISSGAFSLSGNGWYRDGYSKKINS